jgi:type IV pilus assembly protein PilQ
VEAPGAGLPAETVAAQIRARAAQVANNPQAVSPTPKEPLVSNVWIETDIKQVLMDLAAQTKVPIVMDPDTQGMVTLTLTDVPLAVALERITIPLGLTAVRFADGWLVGPPDPKAATYPYLVTTVVYQPRHRRIEELKALLPERHGGLVRVDMKRNLAVITAAKPLAEQVVRFFREVDQPTKQLVIEAIVVDLSRQALDELGISWQGKTRLGEELGAASAAGLALTWSGPLEAVKLLAKLKALETQSQARVIAAPRLLAMEGEPAQLFIGTEQYFAFQSGPVNFPFISIEKVPAGVELELTVQLVTPEAIVLDIRRAEASTAVPTADNRPLVNRRRAATRVRIPNGGTIAIGGLRQRSQTESYESVPLLARVPILGALVGSRRWKLDESELVIFVSATTQWREEEPLRRAAGIARKERPGEAAAN